MNAEYVEQQLEKALPTGREKCLIGLSFGGKMTDEAFHTLTGGLDLDTTNQNYLLMLSSLGFAKGWERFPPEMVPRLKGVHRYHQTRISMGIPWLVRQIRVLTDAGIPVMLLKGVAMLAYYAPGRPRIMVDYDFAVPEERFDRAVKLLEDNGNTLGLKTAHSFALSENRNKIDLHRWIFKTHNEQFSDIWKRAVEFRFHGVDVRVPAPEDMFIHLLHSRSDECFKQENPTRRMQWLYDCRDLWECSGGFDLERLAVRAQEFHAADRMHLMLKLLMRCFPELIKPEEIEQYFPRTPEYDRLLVNGERLRNTWIKYRGYGYIGESAMTPVYIFRWLRFDTIQYRYYKPELKWVDPRMNFFRFFKTVHSLDRFSDLARGYLSRIRLFKKRNRGD